MPRFQRMIVIPQEEYTHLLGMQRMQQPHMTHYQTLQKEYQQQEEIKDPYSRLMHQSDTLADMKTLKDNMHRSLMTATPKPYRSRADTLMKVLEPHVSLTSKGEVVNTFSGNVIRDARMDDLIQHAVRDKRRHGFSPRGWSHFVQLLRDVNVPQIILNRETLNDLQTLRRPIIKRKIEETKLSSKIPRLVSEKRKRKPNTRYTTTDFLITY